jgi:peptide/nickel transport system permease protein
MLGSVGISDPHVVDAYRRLYGLDQPIYVQYVKWVGQLLRGNLGLSIMTQTPVTDLLAARFGATFILAVAGTLIAIGLALPFGLLGAVLSANTRRGPVEQVYGLVPLIILTIPQFSLGLFLVLLLAVHWQLLPPSGMYGVNGQSPGDLALHLLLPAVTLAAPSAAANARLVRAVVLDVLHEDYIRTAHAKGLSPRVVLYAHALRNALIPVVTSAGLLFGSTLSGVVLVEAIFNWPGLGQTMLNAITQRDYPVLQGGTLLIAFMFVMVNLMVDLSYALVDPRVRYSGGRAK